MAFTAEWINRLEQFGRVEYDLILADKDDPTTTFRLSRHFSDEDVIDGGFLSDEADKALIAALTAQAEQATQKKIDQIIKEVEEAYAPQIKVDVDARIAIEIAPI